MSYKRTAFTAILLIFIGFLCVMGVFFVHALFRLETIEVIGTGAVFSANTEKLSTNVLFFPTKTLEDDLRTQYPLFQSVRVFKKFPHTVSIAYTLRDPSGYVQSLGHTYGVDQDSVIVGEYLPPFVHPVMMFDIGIQSIGVKIADVRVRAAQAFLSALDSSLQVSFVKEYSPNAFEARIDSLRILLPVEGNMEDKAHALLFLINGFKIKGVLPSIVDLRYTKPIITK